MPKKVKTSQLVKQGLGTGQLAVFGSAGAAHGLTGMVEAISTFMAGIGNWLFPAVTMLISVLKILTSLWWLKNGNKNIGKWQDLLFNTFHFMLGCGFLAAGIFSTPAIAGLILVSIFATNALYSFVGFCFNFWKSRQKSLQPEAREQYKKNAASALFQFLITGSILAIAGAIIACIALAPPAIAPLVIGMAVVGGIGTLVGSLIFLANLRKRFFSQSENNADPEPQQNVQENDVDFGKGYYGTLKNPNKFTLQQNLENLISSKIERLSSQITNEKGFFGKMQEKKRLAKINRLNLCNIALTREGLIGEESKSDNSRALHSNQVQLVKKYPEDTIQENRLDYLIKEDKKQPQFATSVHQSFWKQVGEVEQIEEQVREFLIPKKSR